MCTNYAAVAMVVVGRSANMSPIRVQSVDVAIVGGGPAGLAAGPRRCPGLRLQVFERGPGVPRKGESHDTVACSCRRAKW